MLKFSGEHLLKYIFSGDHPLKYLYTILVPLLKLIKNAEIRLSLLLNPLKSSSISLKVELFLLPLGPVHPTTGNPNGLDIEGI
jgi:hypothetical protein